MAIAGTTHDLVLDGQGYMLANVGKGYRKVTTTGSRLGLIAVNDTDTEHLQGPLGNRPFARIFWGNWRGLGRKYADGWQATEKNGLVNDLTGLRPVLAGTALALGPQAVSGVAYTNPQTFGAWHTAALSNTQVVSVGDKLFVSADPGTDNTGLVYKATATATVRGIGVFGGQFLVGVSTALYSFNTGTGALTAFAVAHTAELILAYQGVLMVSTGATLYWYIPATGVWSAGVTLESEITALEELDGALYIGTHTALYRLQGTLKSKSPSTAPTALDLFEYSIGISGRVGAFVGTGNFFERNFSKMTAWRGSLWCWIGGKLVRVHPSGVQAGHLELEDQPVTGLSLGLALCGDNLVVISRQYVGGPSTIWLNDGGFGEAGAGWWKLVDGGQWQFPFGNAGYTQGVVNALQYSPSTSHVFYRWPLDQTSPVGFRADNYGITPVLHTGKVTLPQIMPEDLLNTTGGKTEAVKLLRLGVEWATLDATVWWPTVDTISTANCLIRMEISLNGGATWTALTDPVFGNNWYSPGVLDFRGSRFEFAVPNVDAAAQYPASPGYNGTPVSDPGWLVRVTWQGTIMPLLRRIWLDYATTPIEPLTGLAWDLDLAITEPVIGLDDQADSEAALTKLGRLWDLWQAGTTILLVDLDGVSSYRVRVVGIEQRRTGVGAMPNLAQVWTVSVKLVEVFS